MSTLVKSFVADNGINLKPVQSSKCTINNNRHPRHVLKSKNIFKPKCSEALKRKLKKYRLRKDGKEDPEILDVSQILLSSLKIKSPNSKDSIQNSENEELRSKNYLFKMARRKQKTKSEHSVTTLQNSKALELECDISPTTTSQEKKQTNAFKLLMDSRNKSIGSNSPGKEKTTEVSEMQEFEEKQVNKAKRSLALQKMAESKGALKNKELEELKDKIIQKKMEIRAQRLKTMIEKKKTKLEKKDIVKIKTTVVQDSKTDIVNGKNGASQAKTLQLINIFTEADIPRKVSPEKKSIPKEDEEFLNKLSPSMKKKENMLCYFKKIEKTPPVDTEIIKIKVTSKVKKKLKKKKLSLCKEPSSDILKDHNDKKLLNVDVVEQNENTVQEEVNTEEIISSSSSTERRKRKRKENVMNLVCSSQMIEEPTEIEQGRPKRSAKRPVKYIDDVQLSSSDDEPHIFTPKKSKHVEQHKTKHTIEKENDDIINIIATETENQSINQKKKSDKNVKTEKKLTKLAPIFATKTQLNPAELEAKQKFLYSGVPEQLKKIINQQKNASTELSSEFQPVVHVEQNESTTWEGSSVESFYDLPEIYSDNVQSDHDKHCSFKKFLFLSEDKRLTIVSGNSINIVLKDIKELYPKFPVYRTYKLLKGKRKGEYVDCKYTEFDNSIEIINDVIDIVNENPCNLKWTDKYKPLSTDHMLGNFQSIKELKKWLISWKENKLKPKNAASGSDSSDFYCSDTDSTDSTKTVNNLLILNGPVGSGKTCSIYAVAAELAIKVIEVNASSKRTGKVMLQELHEATQSHKVNRGNGSTENSQKSQDVKTELKHLRKRGRPKSVPEQSLSQPVHNGKKEMLSQVSSNQDNARTVMSLILIDDADIVFDQDDGFSSAIAQLVQSSKRPVILVTSSLDCPHLQRFLQVGKVMNMRPFLPRILGTWLDIMCLADNGLCWPGLGSKTLDFFKGDIRKTINCLQFYVTTQKQDSVLDDEVMSQNSDYRSNVDDESSSMSWADQEASQERHAGSKLSVNAEEAWKCFMGNWSSLTLLNYPHDLFNIWWSVPALLNNKSKDQSVKALHSGTSKKGQDMLQLEAVANAVDAISISDYISHMNPDTRSNISSSPWYSSEVDSVSENQCFAHYDRCHEITNEIINELVNSSLLSAQRSLDSPMGSEISFPSLAVQK